MPTDICRRDAFFVRVMMMKVLMPIMNPICVYFWPNGFLRTPAKSGSDALRAAFDTATLGDQPKGLYLNGTDPWPPGKEAKSDENRVALWKDSVEYAGITAKDTKLVNWS